MKNKKWPCYKLLDGHKTIETGVRMAQAFINEHPYASKGIRILDPKYQEVMMEIVCGNQDIPAVCRAISIAVNRPVENIGYVGLQPWYLAEMSNTSVVKPGYYVFMKGLLLFDEERTARIKEKKQKYVAGILLTIANSFT